MSKQVYHSRGEVQMTEEDARMMLPGAGDIQNSINAAGGSCTLEQAEEVLDDLISFIADEDTEDEEDDFENEDEDIDDADDTSTKDLGDDEDEDTGGEGRL